MIGLKLLVVFNRGKYGIACSLDSVTGIPARFASLLLHHVLLLAEAFSLRLAEVDMAIWPSV